MSSNQAWLTEPALLLPPTKDFKCGESILQNAISCSDDSDGDGDNDLPVTFQCTFRPGKTAHNDNDAEHQQCIELTTLEFGCRQPSFGVLTAAEDHVDEETFDQSAVDPNFFDEGYTLAGSTGFCVWGAARFMIEALVSTRSSDDSALLALQENLSNGAHVLELGSGVGLLGTALASGGAQVLMTDLPSLVNSAIQPNLRRNASIVEDTIEAPEWMGRTHEYDAETRSVYKVDRGWASTAILDWSKPIDSQLSQDLQAAVDIVVASDCVWLASMLSTLLDVVDSLFQKGASSFVMSFQRRERNIGSVMFTTVALLIDSIQSRGWKIESRAWRPISLVDKTETQVYLVEVQPPSR